MNVLVTGAHGFVGRNLCVGPGPPAGVAVIRVRSSTARPRSLERGLATADVVFHLAGVNRPEKTRRLRDGQRRLHRARSARGWRPSAARPRSSCPRRSRPSSTTRTAVSKRAAEDVVRRYSETTGAAGVVYRLKNLFGKWCRPQLQLGHGHLLPQHRPRPADPDLRPRERRRPDVRRRRGGGVRWRNWTHGASAASFRMAARAAVVPARRWANWPALIQSFRDQRTTLQRARLLGPLRAGALRHLPVVPASQTTSPTTSTQRTDPRGTLAEFVKSAAFGQIFVSRTQARHHPRQPLPPHQGREVPGRRGRGDHPLPPHR